MQVDLSEALAQDGQFIITNEDGNVFPVAVSGMITLPVTAQMYHSLVQQQIPSSENTVCVTPMQVQNLITSNSLCCSSNSISSVNPTTYLMSTNSNNNGSRNYVTLPIQPPNCQVKTIQTTTTMTKTKTVKKSIMKKRIFSNNVLTVSKSKPKSLSSKVISKNCVNTDNNNCKDIKDKNDDKIIHNENFKASPKKYERKNFKSKTIAKDLNDSKLNKQSALEQKQE